MILGDVTVSRARLLVFFADPRGPTRMMIDRAATRVQAGAIVQVGKRTRRLERSIVKNPGWRNGEYTVRIVADQPYSLYHHQGTVPHWIRPVRRKMLRYLGPGGQFVFARQVRHPGTAPNRFLTDNLWRARL